MPKELEKEILDFVPSRAEWSETLSSIARHHANYDGPCHYSIETDGISESDMFHKYMSWDQEATIVQFLGDYNTDPKIVLQQALQNSVFDYSFKGDSITHIGIGCSCNPYMTILCDFVAVRNVQPKSAIPASAWMPLITGEVCQARCKDNISDLDNPMVGSGKLVSAYTGYESHPHSSSMKPASESSSSIASFFPNFGFN